MLYYLTPLALITTGVRAENKQYQWSREGDNVEDVAIVDDKYEAPRLIRVATQMKNPLAQSAQY